MIAKKESESVLTQKISFSSEDFKIAVIDHDRPAEVERALHEEIEIKYFYEGQCALMINSEMYIVKSGDIAIVNPYEIHTTAQIDKYNGKYYLIVLGLDFLNEVNQATLDLRYRFIAKGEKIQNLIQNDPRLQAILLRIVEEMRGKEENYRLIVQNLISEFFVLLFRNYVNTNHDDTLVSETVKYVEMIAPALSKIHNDYVRKFSLEELAELCNVSKYHFCRIFKRAMNVTPVQYITEYRVDLAETMLKNTANSVSDIAWKCGFDDESYFSRCYKKIKGISPKHVRISMNI